MKWWEMIVLLFTIVSSGVVVAWVIKGEISDIELSVAKSISDIEISVLKVRSVHDLDMATIRKRLTDLGWSRPDHQKWIDALELVSGHPIPSVNWE